MPSEQASGEIGESTQESYRKSIGDCGIIGFDIACDAIRQELRNGWKIHYWWNGEMRRVSRTQFGQDRWESDTTYSDPQDLKDTLEAVDFDEIEIIDKTTFNLMVSGPLEDVSGAHHGICWGIVMMHGSKLEDGRTPGHLSLKIVPGVGDRLASRIYSPLKQYEGGFSEVKQ